MILSEPQQRTSFLRQLQLQHSQADLLPQHPFFIGGAQQAAAPLGSSGGNIDLNGLDLDLDIDLDLDRDINPQSLSSSPISTQSLPSQYSAPLSTLDSIPTIAVPRAVQQGALFKLPAAQPGQSVVPSDSATIFGDVDMMQADSWLPSDQLTPKSAGRFSHQRESSLSSLGSAGPASPYSHNTSNPHIAVTDSLGDGFHGLSGHDDLNYQLAKYPAASHDAFYPNYPNYAPAEAAVVSTSAYQGSGAQPRHRHAAGLLAAADHSVGSSRSRPLSVASSINSDSPATPSGEPEDDRRRKNIFSNSVPKLDRTMTDVYNDELYSPSFSIGSAASMNIPVSPKNDIFAQRVQAANSQHLSVGHSPVSGTARDKSPFRTNSPLAPAPVHDFSVAMNTAGMRFGSAQQLREHRKATQDAQAVRQQLARSSDTTNPPTISPKDAMLDFTDTDGIAASLPLFPQQTTMAVAQPHQQQFDPLVLDDTSFSNYVTSQLPTGLQVPQQYPFIAQPRHQSTVASLSSGSMPHSRLGSTDVGSSGPSEANSPQRPLGTTADGGTYTCTYHGCTQRFETPALLQKHKREGHRQAHGLGASRRPDGSTSVASGLFNSQAGPHRCDRINPSTGKSCNTVFSRPYDLTRHEDTIHNARKQKVRCDLCTDEKTFSRADALTRHYRVCHPDVELQGKHRRRTHA
ncbi:hypothetical protein GQ53DRAFT_654739 [Thozetella sp. PMI_491]|nr:hypothetical protein GQ53DRAFT_654739 [Thozetella sp. PMI_491]